jgi:hypothetical protein
VQSIYVSSCTGDHETIVRLDNDDPKLIEAISILAEFKRVRIVIGPKPDKGYESICDLVNEIALIANGHWVAMLDDDVTLEGDWDTPLRALPLTGVFAKTERYKLEDNVHNNLGRCEGWFAPNCCWKSLPFPVGGHPDLWHPIDVCLRRWLVDENKWQEVALPGTLYNHTNWMRGKGL